MNWKEWRAGLEQLANTLIEYETELRTSNAPLLGSHSPEQVQDSLDTSLPESGEGLPSIIERLQTELLPHVNYNPSPRYAAYITGSGNKPAALAELAKAFLNQNGLKWNSSPIAAELEQLVLAWISDFIRLPEHQHGFLTSCGSTANYYALHFALAKVAPDFQERGLAGAPSYRIYQSDQTHSSVVRAAYFLGLGTQSVVTIPTDEHHRVRVDLLRKHIEEDQKVGYLPLALVANAGSTNTGAVDDLVAMAHVAEECNVWFHVDGAYGLPARGVDSLAPLFAGAERADSVILNPHKWLYVPFEVSTVLLKEEPTIYQGIPSYLQDLSPTQRRDLSTPTIELSKEFRALKVWLTFRYYGAKALRTAITRDVEQVQHVAQILAFSGVLEPLGPHPLSILCFRLTTEGRTVEEANTLNRAFLNQLQERGYLFMIGTEIFGRYCLRICFVSLSRTQKDVENFCRHLIQEATGFMKHVTPA